MCLSLILEDFFSREIYVPEWSRMPRPASAAIWPPKKSHEKSDKTQYKLEHEMERPVWNIKMSRKGFNKHYRGRITVHRQRCGLPTRDASAGPSVDPSSYRMNTRPTSLPTKLYWAASQIRQYLLTLQVSRYFFGSAQIHRDGTRGFQCGLILGHHARCCSYPTRAHGIVATLNQRLRRWFNVATTPCARWDVIRTLILCLKAGRQ